MQLPFHLAADPCYDYKNLSDANRKSSYVTPLHGPSLCDCLLPEGWYRFVGAAGTKMPTTRVPAYRCGADWSGWLDGAHLQWKMVKLSGGSALVIALLVANAQNIFL